MSDALDIMSRSDIPRSYGRFIFTILKILYINFPTGYTSGQAQQEWIRFSFLPYPLQNLFCLVDLCIMVEVRWNLKVILVCTSLIAKDDEHLKKYFLVVRHLHLLPLRTLFSLQGPRLCFELFCFVWWHRILIPAHGKQRYMGISLSFKPAKAAEWDTPAKRTGLKALFGYIVSSGFYILDIHSL